MENTITIRFNNLETLISAINSYNKVRKYKIHLDSENIQKVDNDTYSLQLPLQSYLKICNALKRYLYLRESVYSAQVKAGIARRAFKPISCNLTVIS